MNTALHEPISPSLVAQALRLMNPKETAKPLDLHATASRLGVLPRDLDVALWQSIGRSQ